MVWPSRVVGAALAVLLILPISPALASDDPDAPTTSETAEPEPTPSPQAEPKPQETPEPKAKDDPKPTKDLKPETKAKTGDPKPEPSPSTDEAPPAPKAVDDTYEIPADGTLTVDAPGVLGNDEAAKGVRVTVASAPSSGDLDLKSDGSFTYAAETGGSDSFSYRIDAGDGTSASTATVTLTSSPLVLPLSTFGAGLELFAATFSVQPDSYRTPVGQTLVVAAPGFVGNDTLPPTNTVFVDSEDHPSNGLLTFEFDGSFTYVPNAGFSGIDTFKYGVRDNATLEEEKATVTIRVEAVDAVDDTYSVNAGETLTVGGGGVTDNDTRPGSYLTSVTDDVDEGELDFNPLSGAFTYTPRSDFTGTDTFTYRLYNAQHPSSDDTATVTIEVSTPGFVANDDTYEMAQGSTLDATGSPAGPIANDTLNGAAVPCIPGCVLDVQVQPTHATVNVDSFGGFTYDPDTTFHGTDTFTYRATSPSGLLSNTATVTITVIPAPVANDDQRGGIPESGTLVVSADQSVTGNDLHASGGTLSVVTEPASGQFTLNPDGSFTYEADHAPPVADSFTYQVETAGGTDTATVLLPLSSFAFDDAYEVDQGDTLTVAAPGVLDNDNPPLCSFATTTQEPDDGIVALGPDGGFTYTHDSDFSGTVQFTYLLNRCPDEGEAARPVDTATVTITVNPTTTPVPVAVDDSYSTDAGQQLDIDADSGVLDNDTGDIDANGVTIGTGVSHGALNLSTDGSFSYTPDTGFSGTDTFTYTITGPGGPSAAATATITVRPVAVDDSYTTPFETVLSVPAATGLLANDLGTGIYTLVVLDPVGGTAFAEVDGSFTYTPATGFSGAGGFDYAITDGTNRSTGTGHVTITVGSPPPVANSDVYSTDAGQQLDIDADNGVLDNDTGDIDANDVTIGTGVSHGALNLSTDGSFSYTPDTGFSGTDTFTYTATGTGGSDTATVTITVRPVPVHDSYTTPFETALSVPAATGLLANDLGTGIYTLVVLDPVGGTAFAEVDGSFTYTPATGFTGAGGFDYAITDGTNRSTGTGHVTITVNEPAPAAAVANPDTYQTDQDTPLTKNAADGVLKNDTDATSVTLDSGVTAGTLNLNPDGSFTYTPADGIHGTDSFTYTATGSGGTSEPTTVTITVNELAPGGPVANPDTYETDQDTPLTKNAANGVLKNDTDATSVTLGDDVKDGELVLNPDGSFTYTPREWFSGTDTFTYTATGSGDTSALATVTITVNEVVTPGFVAGDDGYSVEKGQQLTVPDGAILDLLANDTRDGLACFAIDPCYIGTRTDPANGTVSLDGVFGAFTYTPDPDFTGVDTFTYRFHGGAPDFQMSDTATVTITVTEPAPPAPVANPDTYETDQDTPLTRNAANGVLKNDTDATSVTLDSGVTAGTLTLNPDGSFTYTPADGIHGTDSFTYTATGPGGTTAPVTVTITVNDVVAPAPETRPNDYSTDQDVMLTITAPGVLGNDEHADTVEMVTDASDGDVSLSEDGGFTYMPDNGFVGTDTFTYKATGAGGTSEPETVTITVNEVEGAPVANDDSYDVDENETLAVGAPGVLGNDTGYTGARIISSTDHGDLHFDEDGSFTYTPDEDHTGTDEFTYVATNDIQVGQLGQTVGGGFVTLDSGIATVTLTVNADPDSTDDDDDDSDGDSDGDDEGRDEDGDDDKATLPDTGSPVRPADLTAAVFLTLFGSMLIARTRRRGKHTA